MTWRLTPFIRVVYQRRPVGLELWFAHATMANEAT